MKSIVLSAWSLGRSRYGIEGRLRPFEVFGCGHGLRFFCQPIFGVIDSFHRVQDSLWSLRFHAGTLSRCLTSRKP